MDFAQVVELVGERLVERLAQRCGSDREYLDALARELATELDSRGLLALGPPRRWRVRVDDPSAERAYEYDDVEAHSAGAAKRAGARRAIIDDPRATFSRRMPVFTPEQRRQLADDSGLVEAVARSATAVEITTEGDEVAHG